MDRLRDRYFKNGMGIKFDRKCETLLHKLLKMNNAVKIDPKQRQNFLRI